jgi:hypothetical protein
LTKTVPSASTRPKLVQSLMLPTSSSRAAGWVNDPDGHRHSAVMVLLSV